ncbi:hypothetical protein BS47DRAFT_125283 [Hydnum rufescens UP504]|uniref:Uncharacterized protein n=1 Tax=Hydnum rufescens UP504 TaxID=1448309 RepID=A0A9P6DY37_9AGAM|nr:hypothetical protein BS47DRAFT_125283 [Hydnum rufescens UP504]
MARGTNSFHTTATNGRCGRRCHSREFPPPPQIHREPYSLGLQLPSPSPSRTHSATEILHKSLLVHRCQPREGRSKMHRRRIIKRPSRCWPNASQTDLTLHSHRNHGFNGSETQFIMIPSPDPLSATHLTASGPINGNLRSPFEGATSTLAPRLVAGAAGGLATGPQTVHCRQQQQGTQFVHNQPMEESCVYQTPKSTATMATSTYLYQTRLPISP